MIPCKHCGAETTNGLALCELCRVFGDGVLEVLPIYYRNLARWRPGRSGTSRPVPGSRVLYDGTTRKEGTGDRILDRLDEAHNMLGTWACVLTDDRPHVVRPLTYVDAVLSGDLSEESREALVDDRPLAVALLCEGFRNRLVSIATLEWCGEFVRDLAKHEETLRALTPAVPGWYAGACRHCSASTYVMPGLTWNACARCGAVSNASDHLDVILDEAADWIARPKAIAEAIVALVDTEDSVLRLYDRIRWWANNGHLAPIWQITRDYVYDEASKSLVITDVETGHARYRMGDALALVMRDTRSLGSAGVAS